MSLQEPRVIERHQSKNDDYRPVVHLRTSTERKTEFNLPPGVLPTADNLMRIFFPDALLASIASTSNNYAISRYAPKKPPFTITSASLCRFIAAIFYMGIVRLPSKDDYWSSNRALPRHSSLQGLSWHLFKFIWRNLHFRAAAPNTSPSQTSLEQSQPVNPPQDVFAEEDGDELDEPESAQSGSTSESSSFWFDKIFPFVDHIRNISLELVKRPGLCLCIDEMMVRFSGRSAETHRMKNKPISEGYKLYSIADSKTGYVCYFTPDGRHAASSGGNEFANRSVDGGKIHNMLMLLTNKVVQPHSSDGVPFVLFMDNFFTLPRTIGAFRAKNIAVVGTARPKPNWPPSALKVNENATFNDLYWCVDSFGTLTIRWIDNNVVLMVSTAHYANESVSRFRKRPRQTATNRSHVSSVWGEAHRMEIKIPLIVDDYNYFMGGVDVADQIIANYTPKYRFHRTWMPLFVHSCNIGRTNSYTIHKDYYESSALPHKKFVLACVSSFNNRACVFEQSSLARPTTQPFRLSRSRPELPTERLSGPRSTHCAVMKPVQRACIMCRFLKAKKQISKVRKVKKACLSCQFHICTEHFESFHDP